MTDLSANAVSVSVKGQALVRDASLRVRAGELVVLLGPNGAGKTSLLRALLGVQPAQGEVILNGKNLADYTRTDRARAISYLPQARTLAWPGIVRDIVALGRFPHGADPDRLSDADKAIIDQAIDDCDLNALADRQAATLSGGEQGRMHCARAFASEARFIIADEPVAALDPLHQFRIMDLFRAHANKGNGVLLVLHDVSLAARFADQIIWMKDGKTLDQGSVEKMLTVERITSIYGMSAQIKGTSVNWGAPFARQ